MTSRRDFLQAAIAVSVVAPQAASAADPSVIAGARQESGLLWYDHYDRDDSLTLMKAFQKAYPFVKSVEFVDVPSAQKTAKVLQESMAGGPTTDIILNDPPALQQLVDRGFALSADWAKLGVATSPTITPSANMVLATTAVYVVLVNKSQVPDAEIPTSWDAIVDPKWKGRTGHWMRAAAFHPLLPKLGEDRVRDLVRRMAAQQPRLFDGLFPLAQAIGSGELAMGVTGYDSARRVVESGAPVTMRALDLTPVDLLYGAALKYGEDPNTARLFLSWLSTDEGGLMFEKTTRRGNLFIAASDTAKFLKGREVSYIAPADSIRDAKRLSGLEAEFGRMLAGR